MQQFEFFAQINPDQTISLPAEVAARLAPAQEVHVLVAPRYDAEPEIPAEDDDSNHFVARQFLEGYADDDSIYDDLSTA
jgi:hypothetical protein